MIAKTIALFVDAIVWSEGTNYVIVITGTLLEFVERKPGDMVGDISRFSNSTTRRKYRIVRNFRDLAMSRDIVKLENGEEGGWGDIQFNEIVEEARKEWLLTSTLKRLASFIELKNEIMSAYDAAILKYKATP